MQEKEHLVSLQVSWEPEVACRAELPQHLPGLSLPKILGHCCHKRCTAARRRAAPLRAKGGHQSRGDTRGTRTLPTLSLWFALQQSSSFTQAWTRIQRKNVLQRPSCASTELACEPAHTQPLWINICPRWPQHLELNKTSPVTKPQTTVTISTQLERLWFPISVTARVSPFKGERKPQVAICFDPTQYFPLSYTCPFTLQLRNISHDELSCCPALIFWWTNRHHPTMQNVTWQNSIYNCEHPCWNYCRDGIGATLFQQQVWQDACFFCLVTVVWFVR